MSIATRPPPARLDPSNRTREVDLGRHQSWVLVAAFTLSLVHTIYAEVVGIASPGFTVSMPTTWTFYALGFAAAVLARQPARRVQQGVLAWLVVLVVVSMTVYPATFTPEQQTPFAWVENDTYVALLVLALWLGIQRLRGLVAEITPRRS